MNIVLPHLFSPKGLNGSLLDDVADDSETERSVSLIDDEDEPTEQSHLIGGGKRSSPAARLFQHVALHVELFAGLIGLLIGLIKPVQRTLIGTQEAATGGWSSIGGGLVLLAAAYATVDMLSVGAGMRAGEKR